MCANILIHAQKALITALIVPEMQKEYSYNYNGHVHMCVYRESYCRQNDAVFSILYQQQAASYSLLQHRA